MGTLLNMNSFAARMSQRLIGDTMIATDDLNTKTPGPGSAEAGGEVINSINDLLQKVQFDSPEFNAILECLSIQTLRYYNHDLFYLNYLSLFSGTMTLDQIAELAVQATRLRIWSSWENYWRIMDLMRRPSSEWTPMLKGWDTSQIRRLLALGKGLVVCTTHVGAYRHVPTDLAMLGFRVCVALDGGMSRFFDKFIAHCRRERADAKVDAEPPFMDRLHVVNVEQDTHATIALMNCLRRNEIVVVFLDGNSGLDGIWGKSNKCSLRFLNHALSVRTGAIEIALAVEAPVLSVTTMRGDRTGSRIVSRREWAPDEPRTKQARRVTGCTWIESVYHDLEAVAAKHPIQWETACLFHRWRDAGPRTSVDSDGALGEVRDLLDSGAHLRLRNDRIAFVWSPLDGEIAVDAATLISYRFPSDIRPVILRMAREASIDREWIRSNLSYTAQEHLLTSLAQIRHLCVSD